MSDLIKQRWNSLLMLLLVVALHAGAVGVMVWAPSPDHKPLELPTVQGILLPAPPAEVAQIPSVQNVPPPVVPPPLPEPPKPKPKPKPKPVVQPKPKPPIEAPPSEKAIRQEEAVPEEIAPPPPQQVAIAAEDNKALGAPVTPPREDANLLNNPRPGYPNLSRRLREEGTVVLEVLILPDGKVGEVRIKESSGFKRLDETAVKAVRQWTYVPARQGDEAIAYWYLQPLEFSLQ